jgi:hypothetical protein
MVRLAARGALERVELNTDHQGQRAATERS